MRTSAKESGHPLKLAYSVAVNVIAGGYSFYSALMRYAILKRQDKA